MALAQAAQELGPKLSSAAKITFPDDPSYGSVKARWSDYKAPQPGVVVTVASESDIEQTVCTFASLIARISDKSLLLIIVGTMGSVL